MNKHEFLPVFEDLVSLGIFQEILTGSNINRDFARCARCTDTCANFVPPAGRYESNDAGGEAILFIGEAPGQDEDARQIPFIGKSGQEFTRTYLKRAGIDRNDYRVVITNVCKCRPPNNKTPVPSQIRACAEKYLLREIASLSPRLIVTLGNVALQFVNMYSKADVAGDPERLNLEAHHGFVFWRDFSNWTLDSGPIPVFVAYHPAAGMRDGAKMQGLLEDMDALNHVLKRASLEKPEPVEEQVYYCEVDTPAAFDEYLEDCWLMSGCPGASYKTWVHEWDLDSEDDDDGSLYSVQISAAERTAVMIDGKNTALLRYVGDIAQSDRVSLISMHYAEHDWERLESQLGWKIDISKVHDTLKEAFNLGNQPKKLKALAYRLSGVVMTSFHDLVYPYSAGKAVEFLEMLAAHPVTQHYPKYGKKGQLLKTVDSNPLNSHVNRILRYTKMSRDNPDEDRKPYPVWEKWEDLIAKETNLETKFALVEKLRELRELGLKMPGFSIRHVPRKKAVWYGCKDADVTRRVRRKMGPMLESLGKEVEEVADVVLKKGWVKE